MAKAQGFTRAEGCYELKEDSAKVDTCKWTQCYWDIQADLQVKTLLGVVVT